MSDLLCQVPAKHSWYTNCRETFYGEWKCAYEIFSGKDIREAELLFAKHKFYQLYLSYMPSIPFRYYSVAYVNYLMGDNGKNDIEGLLIFLDILENQLGLGGKCADDACFIWKHIIQLFDFVQMNNYCFNRKDIEEKISHIIRVKTFIDTCSCDENLRCCPCQGGILESE
jgi:hypothetical protein